MEDQGSLVDFLVDDDEELSISSSSSLEDNEDEEEGGEGGEGKKKKKKRRGRGGGRDDPTLHLRVHQTLANQMSPGQLILYPPTHPPTRIQATELILIHSTYSTQSTHPPTHPLRPPSHPRFARRCSPPLHPTGTYVSSHPPTHPPTHPPAAPHSNRLLLNHPPTHPPTPPIGHANARTREDRPRHRGRVPPQGRGGEPTTTAPVRPPPPPTHPPTRIPTHIL